MSTTSANLGLTLPESFDKVDVDILSGNFQKIDESLGDFIDEEKIANNLITTEAGKVLDARQGKVLKDAIDKKLASSSIANNLTTTSQGFALDARQGKALNESLNAKTDELSRSIQAKASKSNVTVTLSIGGWSGSGPYTQAVNASGVTASNAVVVSPAPASFVEYGACGVRASAQASGKLTFTATAKPAAALSVYILCIN